jgi:hypothetical protein
MRVRNNFSNVYLLVERLGTYAEDENYIRTIKQVIKNNKFNERIEIRLARELSPGRSRMNCTVKDSDGNWRWFGHQFYF